MSVNKIILLGRLGQDPELKYTPSGAAVCNFSLATTEAWTDKASGQKQERTEWHRVVVWGKLAELCNQYLAKGRQAFVEGRLQTRSWDDASGNKRYTTEIMASTIQFIGGQAGTGAGASSQNGYNAADSMGANASHSQQHAQPAGQEYNIDTDVSFASDDIPF